MLSSADNAMTAWYSTADDILRRAPWVAGRDDSRRAHLKLVGSVVVFGLLYGATMGCYRGLTAESQWSLQIAYSAAKVPILLTATFVISLPSFFVFNSLLGLRNDFGQAVRSLVAAQAGLAIVLASLAPFTLLWYASSAEYGPALLFNGGMFAIASGAGQWLVRGYYRPLIAKNYRHRWVLWSWLCVYVLVGIQMAWPLRPFIGSPMSEVRFLRPDPWDNAYEFIARLVWRTLFP
jgi:hypothetical protein